MQKYTTVIEISSQWLKLVATKPSPKGLELVNLVVQPVSSLSIEGLSGELTALLKKLKFTPYPLLVSFPRNLVTLRNLHLPSHDPKEIKGMVDLHMVRQVPYPRDEIIGDYQTIGIDETGYAKVILAIAHRESLQRIFNVLNTANLFPEKVELSSQGVLSWLICGRKAHLEAGKIYILLDIDSNFTDFMLIDKDSLLFSRSIAYGIEQVFIEEIKRTKFIAELKQSLAIFQSEETNKKPAKVFITGATDNVGSLATLLETELDVRVEIIKQDANAPKNISLSAILGLAYEPYRKRINFILPEVQIRRALKERSKEIILLGSLLMLTLVVSSGIFLERMYNRSGYQRLLDNRYEELKEDIEELETMSKKIKVVRERLNSRTLFFNYLYQVQRVIPNEITLKMISVEVDDKVTLRGQAQAMSDIPKFKDTLEKSGYFKDIQTKYMTKKRIADKEISEFELVCPIK